MYLAQPGSGSGGLRVGQGCTPQAPIIPMSVLASLPGPAGVHPYSAFPGSLHLAQPAPAASLEEVVCGQPSAVLLRPVWRCHGVTDRFLHRARHLRCSASHHCPMCTGRKHAQATGCRATNPARFT